jgi:hypothetical protein
VGGSLDVVGLLALLRDQFQFVAHPDFRSGWEILRRRSQDAMANIADAIDGTARLLCEESKARVAESLRANRTCILIGESGSGKSALTQQSSRDRKDQTIWLTPAYLDKKTVSGFEQAMGLRHTLTKLLLSSDHPCLVVFDGIEAYSSEAFALAARIIKENV